MDRQNIGTNINFGVLIEAVKTCRADPRWRGRWILDDDWLTIVKRATGRVFETCSRAAFNTAIARSPKLKHSLDDFDSNTLGFVRRCFSTKERKFTAYYASVPKSPVVRPPDGSKWYEEIMTMVIQRLETCLAYSVVASTSA